MKALFCVSTKCEKAHLVLIPAESTVTMQKFFCPVCGRPYGRSTGIGQAAQVAPAVIASVILIKSLTAVLTAAIGHHDGDIDFFN